MSSPISRRLKRKEKRMREVEDRYLTELQDRQEIIDEKTIEQFFVAVGWALYTEFGWKANGIGRVWTAMNAIIGGYAEDETKYAQIKKQLKEKAYIEIKWRD